MRCLVAIFVCAMLLNVDVAAEPTAGDKEAGTSLAKGSLGKGTGTADGASPLSQAAIDTKLRSYLENRTAEFDQIPIERKTQLKKISLYVHGRSKANQISRLTFICTHNSRRSQMSQIWAATAADYYGFRNIETFSGGTETTAFNPRAVAAIERAGLIVDKTDESKNPRYTVRIHQAAKPLVCFSKVYNEAPNPSESFCAVMTCAQADKNCPIVDGCSLRVSLPYDDPKAADDTPEEPEKYDERCRQICREMLYLFSQVER